MIVYITGDDEEKLDFSAFASICPQGKGFASASGRPTVIYLTYNLVDLEDDYTDEDPRVLVSWI